jgi:hypothetical protein
MKDLIQYVIEHTHRGECQCGRCCDKQPDRAAPLHSVNVHFFWVSAHDEPDAAVLKELLLREYPSPDRLRGGPSYIEIGGELGSQEIALLLIGPGAILGMWTAITPEQLGFEGEEAASMAGSGFVMCSGFKP